MIQLLTPVWSLGYRAVLCYPEGKFDEYLQKLAEKGKVLLGLYRIPSSQKRIAIHLSRIELTIATSLVMLGKLRFVGYFVMSLKTYEKCCNGSYFFGTFKEIFDGEFNDMCSRMTLWGRLMSIIKGVKQ